jgi:hypothetical protein
MIRCSLLAFSIARFRSAKNILRSRQPSFDVAQKQVIRPTQTKRAATYKGFLVRRVETSVAIPLVVLSPQT